MIDIIIICSPWFVIYALWHCGTVSVAQKQNLANNQSLGQVVVQHLGNDITYSHIIYKLCYNFLYLTL